MSIVNTVVVACSDDVGSDDAPHNISYQLLSIKRLVNRWCCMTILLPVCLQMTNPAIQNDFSYYRRTLNRRKMVSHSHFWFHCGTSCDLSY